MKTIFSIEISNKAIIEELQKQTNQIYKLLPLKEEQGDWRKLLDTITLEFVGMNELLLGMHSYLFPLLCKLKGLSTLSGDKDFMLYRKTVFECLTLVGEMIRECQDTTT